MIKNDYKLQEQIKTNQDYKKQAELEYILNKISQCTDEVCCSLSLNNDSTYGIMPDWIKEELKDRGFHTSVSGGGDYKVRYYIYFNKEDREEAIKPEPSPLEVFRKWLGY